MANLIKKELTLDSREVAKMVEKQHSELLKDIRRYISYLAEGNFHLGDFFTENTYLDKNNQERPNYQITKKGCEFIAHKLTGQKGTLFTATYINRFHEMEKTLVEGNKLQAISDVKAKEIEARYNNSLVRKANALRKIAEDSTTPNEYKQVLNSKAVEIITGKPLLPLPETEKTYAAGDIAKELGTSANMIGRTANKYDLKTDEYGLLVWDKSPHSSKQVQSWRYNEKGRRKLIEILGGM